MSGRHANLTSVRAAAVCALTALTLVAAAWAPAARAYTTTDVNASIADGVAYIDSQQNPDGSFGSFYAVAETGFAIVAYGVLDQGDFANLTPAYQAHLKSAVTWLLGRQDPTSGAFGAHTGIDTYATGIALEALSVSAGVDPGIPAAITKARNYLVSTQNAPPSVTGNPSSPNCTGADGSGTEMYCGGWNYDAGFGRSDESNTGFAMTGLALTGGVPAASAAVNVEWQRHVQELKATNPLATVNTGGGSYTPGQTFFGFYSNANDTGSLIFGYGYDGVPAADTKVQAAVTFGKDVIDEYELMKATVRSMIYHPGSERDGTCTIGSPGCTWAVAGDGGYHYSIWALTKGLGQYIPPDLLLTDATNWYDKVVDLLLSQQDAGGSWPVDGRDDATSIAATSFAVSSLGVVGARPDLRLTKSDSPDPVAAGSTLTYDLTVHNGGGDASGVTLTDSLPAGVTFVSATASQGSCSQAGGTVTCSLGDLGENADATVQVKVTPTSAGTLTNNASVTENEDDSDTSNNSTTATTTVTPPPVTVNCSKVAPNVKLLWPPNHKFHLVTLSAGAGSGITIITVTSVRQDEPVNARGDGNTSPDAKAGPAGSQVYLRAERSGGGDGRVYRISFSGSGGGSTCTGAVTVGVPHDQGKHSTPRDSGHSYNSFGT